MFTIRSQQMRAFDPQTLEELEAFLLAYAREHHAELTEELPDDDLVLCIRSALARAAQYKSQNFPAATLFLGLMLDFAPNFDEHPEVQAILRRPGQSPDEALEVVSETSEEAWEEILANYDPQGWHFGLVPHETGEQS